MRESGSGGGLKVSLIVAAAENDVIGHKGDLPWRLPADLRRFRTLTTGHHILMGRKTWDSLPGLLPQREHIVLSRNAALQIPGATVCTTMNEALAHAEAAGEEEVFVIGGEAIYAAALPRADRIYLTRVHTAVEGDALLPALPLDEFDETDREEHPADERHAFAFTFLTLERRTERL